MSYSEGGDLAGFRCGRRLLPLPEMLFPALGFATGVSDMAQRRHRFQTLLNCAAVAALASGIGCFAGTVAVAEEPVDYSRDIKSVLRERCYACHGVLKSESGLR